MAKVTNNNKKKKRISKNTAYRRGRYWEYKVKKFYERLGYFVIRSYASKGAQDLTCFKKIISCHDCVTSEVLIVQCKFLKQDKKLAKKEQDALITLANWTGAIPIHAKNVKHKLIEEYLIEGRTRSNK